MRTPTIVGEGYKSALEPTLRELRILRLGHLSGSSYEVHQHRKIAAVGPTQDCSDCSKSLARPGEFIRRS